MNDVTKHDLVIYSKNIDFYLKNIGTVKKEIQKLTNDFILPITLSFHIFPDDLSVETGVKINELLEKLIKDKINFSIYPLPLCLFKKGYSSNIKSHLVKEYDKTLVFLYTDSGIKHIHSNADVMMLKNGQVLLFAKCFSCRFQRNKQCKGIFVRPGSFFCTQKIKEWLYDKIESLRKVKLLDIGCGAHPPFLDLYKKLSIGRNKIYLLDPSSDSLLVLSNEIPHQYNNIVLVRGKAEKLEFKNKMFDIIILLDSYSHLIDLRQSFKHIKKILKQNGILIIKDGKDLSFNKKTERGEEFTYHLRNHSLKKAILELQKYGFKIIDSFAEQSATNIIWTLQAKKK